jgi:hypothetical protein
MIPLKADGFSDAIIGTTTDGRFIYDAHKMVDILVARDGMAPEEACEYLEFNTFSAYVGEGTPIYVYPV